MTPASANAVAEELRKAWARAFRARDAEALANLYTQEAMFFGSTPDLYRGRDGVRAYFSTLRADVTLDEFEPGDVVQTGEDTMIAAGYWQFLFGTELRRYRLTWTIVQQSAGWLIAAHHASPR